MKASDATGHRLDIITEELQFCDLNSKKEKSWHKHRAYVWTEADSFFPSHPDKSAYRTMVM